MLQIVHLYNYTYLNKTITFYRERKCRKNQHLLSGFKAVKLYMNRTLIFRKISEKVSINIHKSLKL